MEYFLLDKQSREDKTVKVNVAWDENDYQIDVGTEAGMTEYKRIIDRNHQFGTHRHRHRYAERRSERHSELQTFSTRSQLDWF